MLRYHKAESFDVFFPSRLHVVLSRCSAWLRPRERFKAPSPPVPLVGGEGVSQGSGSGVRDLMSFVMSGIRDIGHRLDNLSLFYDP